MKKRIAAILLALSLMLSFTACKKNPGSSEGTVGSSSDYSSFNEYSSDIVSDDATESIDSAADNSSNANTSSGSSANKNTSDKNNQVSTVGNSSLLPKINLTNKTVKVMLHYDFTESSTIASYARDTYGIKIEMQVVPFNQLQNKFINATLAGKGPDLYPDPSVALMNSGYVTRLDGKFDWTSKLWSGVKSYVDANKWKGGIWTVPDGTTRDAYVFYNKEMLDEAGEAYPADLFKQGKWNWDTFYDMAQNLTVDAKNTGTPTQYGVVLGEYNDLLATTGTVFVSMNSSGIPQNNLKSAAVQRYMDFIVKLKKSTAYYGGSANVRDAFAQGQVAMVVGRSWYRSSWTSMIKKGMVGSAPVPKDPQADKSYISESSGQSWAISSKASNPQGAVALINVMRLMYIDENIQKQALDLSIQSGVMTQQLNDEMQLNYQVKAGLQDWVGHFGFPSYVADIYNRPLNGEPWSTVAEEVSDSVDFYISEAMRGKIE